MSLRLIFGDSIEQMRQLADKSIDLILADLPYGTTRCSWDSIIPLEPLWEQYRRIIKPRGAIVLTAAQPFTSALVMSNPKWFRHDWVWEKGAASGHLNAKRAPMRAHESVLVFCEGQPTYNPQMTHGHKRKSSVKRGDITEVYGAQQFEPIAYDSTSRYPRSVQFFSSDKQRSKLHPTQKPLALMEYCVRTYSNPGETVLDNVMGSGTTGLACVNTGRQFIGIEDDLGHFATAQARLNSTNQLEQAA